MNERPLITFALIAYNQEQYIREAVQGALAQTYSPLEIIISDDCSPDATFGIMEELTKVYGGDHRIVLNRNETNLGLGGHVNRIMELAHGEYIVIAAGDDISVPERTQRTFEAFVATKGHTFAAFSDSIEIDENGKEQGVVSAKPPERFTELPEMCRHLFRGITGATNAWHRSVFDLFGPMREGIVFEDRVIAFRAALLGEICHIPQPLVRYRRHEANTVGMFYSTSNTAMQKRLQCFRDVYLNNSCDLERVVEKADVDQIVVAKCRAIMRREIRKLDGYLRFFSGGVGTMLAGLVQVILNGGNPWHAVRQHLRSIR